MVQLIAGVDKDHRQQVEENLVAFNNARSPVMRALRGRTADDELPLQVSAVDGSGGLAGGLVGYTWGHWLHIDLLWVAEAQRGTGVGTALVRRAERDAAERGCVHARVESWSFQAPDFYRKLGYRVVGVLEDYPPGVTDYLLARALTGVPGGRPS